MKVCVCVRVLMCVVVCGMCVSIVETKKPSVKTNFAIIVFFLAHFPVSPFNRIFFFLFIFRYEFEFSPITMPTNLRTIVFSEGKSMLPVDLHVPLVMDTERGPAQDVSSESADQMRGYISAARMLPHTISEDVQRVIESDFVEMRQKDPKNVLGSTLHNLLSLARYVLLSDSTF